MPRKRGITDEMIIEMYKSGRTHKEMEELFGLSSVAILNVIHKHNIPINRKQYSGRPRKNYVNEHYFKVWSHEMAWVLGLLVTDGHINKGTHTINFSQKDERILQLIATYLEADYVLAPYGKTKKTPTLIVNSKIMKEDLAILGITPNKSLTVPFPKIPTEYLASFVRGVIDGDGWVENRGYSTTVTSASLEFANALLNLYQSWYLKSGILIQTTINQNTIYRIWVKGKADVAKLSEVVYRNADTENFHIYKRVFMSQHAQNPYLIEDTNDPARWKINNGKIVLIPNSSRIGYKSRISQSILDKLKIQAANNNTYVNYMIERALKLFLEKTEITFTRNQKPKDRVEFSSTYDKELIEQVKLFAKSKRVPINEIIEYSIQHIDSDMW
ncbi:LAGLIDADG family homing endonuclease [Psychrobacillus sp. NPDC093180]|uniref:LAGLIDADG family homing endonuclease n=1 Tax=Psychrobacillus sp. NPDC093180 TaxID=3364489 RepID=UPI0037F73BC5